MAADGLDVAETVCLRRDRLLFVAGQGPKLPAAQAVAMPEMEEGINVIFSHHILLPAFDVEGKHDKENVVAEQPVFEVAIKGDERGVILAGIGRTLLEIEGEDGKAVPLFFLLCRASRPTQKLKELPAELIAITVVGEQRIEEIKFRGLRPRISGVGKQRGGCPNPLSLFFFGIEQRAQRLSPMAGVEGQVKLI